MSGIGTTESRAALEQLAQHPDPYLRGIWRRGTLQLASSLQGSLNGCFTAAINHQLMNSLDGNPMNAADLEREFWRMCQIANSADTLEASVPDLEPFLLDILRLVKANQDQKEVFVRCFIALVDGSRTYTDWIVLFCMRELRWQKVREAANRRFELAGGINAPRLMNWISHINWAYDDAPWEDALFFLYFWKKEHPGEPWPCQASSSPRS